MTRLAELKPVNAGMREESAALQGERPNSIEQKEVHMQENMQESTGQQSRQEITDKHRSRRQLLRKGIVAATAALGVGAVLDTGIASAHTNLPADNVGNFSSSNSSVPAVTATGTNGATGVNASSDSGYGLYVTSASSGDSLFAKNTGGGTGNAMHAWNNSASASALYAEGHAGTGVYSTSDTSNGVYGWSGTNVGVYASTNSGHALVANGHVQIQGDAVGLATLSAGKTSVTVTTSAATTSSNILLTPLGNPQGNLWVTRASGSFTIHSSKAPTSNLSISYLIVN